jgi:hypothetical protein
MNIQTFDLSRKGNIFLFTTLFLMRFLKYRLWHDFCAESAG